MYSSPIQLHYQGFHPSDWVEEYISANLEEIKELAPSGSTIEAHYLKQNELFKGTLHLRSAAGPIFASATGSNLREVTKKLNAQMHRRFDKLKSKYHSKHLAKTQGARAETRRDRTQREDSNTEVTSENGDPDLKKMSA